MKKLCLKFLTVLLCFTVCLFLFVACDENDVKVETSGGSSAGSSIVSDSGNTDDDEEDIDDVGGDTSTGGGLIPGGNFEAH